MEEGNLGGRLHRSVTAQAKAERFVRGARVTQHSCAKLLAQRYRAESVSSKEVTFSSELKSWNCFAENRFEKFPLALG